MTPSYLPSLEPATVKREKVRKRVRPTSIAQYAEGRERFKGRRGDVLRWLAAFYNRFQVWPTAAELGCWLRKRQRYERRCAECFALHIRKGVSQLIDTGLVRSNGERVCDISGRTVEAWRITPAGRVAVGGQS
jgi:hypothetical protein